VRPMPDPRFRLTAQELVYAASAMRAEARRAAQQAADPQYQCSRAIFEHAAKVYGELAGKLDRIAQSRATLERTWPNPERVMNWLYEQAQKHAQESMLDFAGMEMTDALRGLIRSKITLAYTTACRAAWEEAGAAVRLSRSLQDQFPAKPGARGTP
jgi:hypothetical protein